MYIDIGDGQGMERRWACYRYVQKEQYLGRAKREDAGQVRQGDREVVGGVQAVFPKKGREPVAHRQRPVARHYLELLKKHLQELLEGDVIEGPRGSEHSTGWVSNVVIIGKS